MHIKRKNSDKERILRTLESKFWTMNPEGLDETRKNFTLEHAQGRTVTGDYELDCAALNVLARVAKSKQPATDRDLDQEANQLAREHGVSAKTARTYLEREALREQRVMPELHMSAAEIAKLHHVSEATAANWLKRNTRPAPPIEQVQRRTIDVHNEDELGLARADARYVTEEQ